MGGSGKAGIGRDATDVPLARRTAMRKAGERQCMPPCGLNLAEVAHADKALDLYGRTGLS